MGLASYHQAQNRFRQKFQNFISEFLCYTFRQFWHVLQIDFKLQNVSSREMHVVIVYDCHQLQIVQFPICMFPLFSDHFFSSFSMWPCLGSEPTFSSSSSNLLSTASANCYLPLCCAFPIPRLSFCFSLHLFWAWDPSERERNTPGMNQLEVSHERILALYFLSSSIHNRNTSNWDRSRCCWKHGSQKSCFQS